MDKIIEDVESINEGYKLKNNTVKIIGYADGIVLIAKSEDGLQRMLHKLRPIEQVMKFPYLGILITSYGDITEEVKIQTNKGVAVSGALKDVVWKNKDLSIQTKTRINTTCTRPIMAYSIETRVDTKKTKQLLRTNEMKILRSITGKRITDRIRNDIIRDQCNDEDIVRRARKRRRKWIEHVQRMTDNSLVKECILPPPV